MAKISASEHRFRKYLATMSKRDMWSSIAVYTSLLARIIHE